MKLTIRETAVFGMLGGVMYASKLVLDVLPNIHLLGMFTMAFTLVYRKKALYPIYTYVLLLGIFNGFSFWWVPHLYVWTILWVITMVLPPKAPPLLYMIICAVHGFLYGVMCAPAQAFFFGLDRNGTLAWIAAGIPFDLIHGVSNFFCAALIIPVAKTITSAQRRG